MRSNAQRLLDELLELDEDDRASVAEVLIETLSPSASDEIDRAWEEEVRARIDDLDSGRVEIMPWSVVRERLFDGLD